MGAYRKEQIKNKKREICEVPQLRFEWVVARAAEIASSRSALLAMTELSWVENPGDCDTGKPCELTRRSRDSPRSKDMEERRARPRRKVSYPCWIADRQGELRNISEQGAMIEIDSAPDQGTATATPTPEAQQ